jgi:hypothetical protein
MQAADRKNEPGKFTALVDWEWSQIASGVNLHRIIVTDADGDTASGFDPAGSDDAPYPEQLWAQLDVLAKQPGANCISIPNNSNLSKGYMFAKTSVKSIAINAAYA